MNERAPWKPDLQPATGLDPGIAEIVNKLRAHGVETYESCEAGDGHHFPEPTVRFHCGLGGEWQALGVALMLDLPVVTLRQFWRISRQTGTPEGPEWEMTFRLDGYVGAPYIDQIAEADRGAREADYCEHGRRKLPLAGMTPCPECS